MYDIGYDVQCFFGGTGRRGVSDIVGLKRQGFGVSREEIDESCGLSKEKFVFGTINGDR